MLESSESAQLLTRYGYLAILAGTMLEGETVVLVAGFLAHQGYLKLPWIIIAAIMGSTISDQGLFFLSRFKGTKLLSRFPKMASKVNAMTDRMRSRPVALGAFALFFRFLYGLRNISPVFLGISTIPTLEFVVLNALGAVLWAVCFSLIGYAFSGVLEAVLGNLAHVEVGIALLVILAVGGAMAYRQWKQTKAPK